MALVQALPVSVTDRPGSGLDAQPCHPLSSSHLAHPCSGPCGPAPASMGSVSSLISGRSYQERHCRAAASEHGANKPRRSVAPSSSTTGCFRLQDKTLRSGSSLEQLLVVSHHMQQTQAPAVQPPPLPNKKHHPPRPAGNSAGAGGGVGGGGGGTTTNGNYRNACDEEAAVLVGGDWNDKDVVEALAARSPCSDSEEQRDHRALDGTIGGPPPKLVPVSGQLEKNMEKVLIRPTAFKPVVPKNRHSVQYLSPRPGGGGGVGMTESQGSLNLLLPVGGSGIASCTNGNAVGGSSADGKRNSYSGGRNARSSQSCSMSDSGRNSLSSLPTHSSTGYSLAPSEGSSSGGSASGSGVVGGGGGGGGPIMDPIIMPGLGGGRTTSGGGGGGGSHHGHTNSDSGRSSSSKSTGSGSLSGGRCGGVGISGGGGGGQPLSDSGSCGHSPLPLDGYEGVVRELEDKLRERDLELQTLRDNLDENEAAICQVYEEKQRRCEGEMEELRQSCATKMKQASQKNQRAQQVLQLQVFQLQQEKKKLQEDFSSLLQDRETLERRCANIQREHTQLGPRLEETKWEVCQKSGEISLLKQQLKELQSELSQKAGEIVILKAQLREVHSELQSSQARSQEAGSAVRTRALELEVCENELQRRKSEAELLREKMGRLEEESARLRDALSAAHAAQAPLTSSGNQCSAAKGQCASLSLQQGRCVAGRAPGGPCSGPPGGPCPPAYRDGEAWGGESDEAKAQRQNAENLLGLKQQVERLKAELMYERRSSEEQLSGFEEERRVWQEEKDKVIRYQKQLQQNYIHMYRRNRDLERVMRELSLELENHRQTDAYDMHGGSTDICFEEITATEI